MHLLQQPADALRTTDERNASQQMLPVKQMLVK
jgi:hypothetical protein